MPDRYGDEPDWPEIPPPQTGPDELWAAEQNRHAIDNCNLCDDEGYNPAMQICDHIDRTETHKRGIELCRQALRKAKEGRG